MSVAKHQDSRRNDQRLRFVAQLERVEKELERRVAKGEKVVLQSIPSKDPLGYPRLRVVKAEGK